MKKDLLKLLDLSSQDILTILDTADQLKAMKKAGIQHPFLAGKTLAMIFEKSSTRTRVSFETGMYQLGGNAIYLSTRTARSAATSRWRTPPGCSPGSVMAS